LRRRPGQAGQHRGVPVARNCRALSVPLRLPLKLFSSPAERQSVGDFRTGTQCVPGVTGLVRWSCSDAPAKPSVPARALMAGVTMIERVTGSR
jgi:hypothetical protein